MSLDREQSPSWCQARYLTPFRIDGHSVCGAAYTEDLQLVPSSLRDSSTALYRHRDPAFLFPCECSSAESIHGEKLYLGHCHGNWGHFLLETLPMLSYLLEKGGYVAGIFLPWGQGKRLLQEISKSLALENRVSIHDAEKVLQGDFLVPPRPIRINKFGSSLFSVGG